MAGKPPTLPARETIPPLTSTVTTLDLGGEDGAAGRRKRRAKPTVPEYLREPRHRRRGLPVAVAVLLIGCFSVVVLKSLGQLEPGTPLGDVMVQWGVEPRRLRPIWRPRSRLRRPRRSTQKKLRR